MAKYRPIAARISPHQTQRTATHRGASHALVLHRPLAEPRNSEPEPHTTDTLLPWADPYIADLHRRHEGELRRERRERRERE